jgi:hypothetical protein
VTGVLVLFSGVMDYMWFVVNGLDYATQATSIPHIEVIIGRVPGVLGLFAFIGVHLALAIGLVLTPIDKLLKLDRGALEA